MIKIWRYINGQLIQFRSCFTREATFNWFLLVVVGLMTRSDHLGVTSIVRELMLDPAQYHNLIHFFRSDAWKLDALKQEWLEIVKAAGKIWRLYGMPILIGDGVNVDCHIIEAYENQNKRYKKEERIQNTKGNGHNKKTERVKIT